MPICLPPKVSNSLRLRYLPHPRRRLAALRHINMKNRS